MKVLLMMITLLSAMSAYAQRVSEITRIRHNQYRPEPDTTLIAYQYEDTLLSQVLFSRKGKVFDQQVFSYKKNKVTVKSERNGKTVKSFAYNKETGQLATYGLDQYVTLVFSYDEGKISSIDVEDTYHKYEEANMFVYEGKQLSKIKSWNKKGNPAHSTDYVLTYQANKVKRMVWGDNIEVYELVWDKEQLKSIEHQRRGDLDYRHEFTYDAAGRIIQERFFDIAEGEEVLREELKIAYSEAPGNDQALFDLYHWKYNTLLGVRTFTEYKALRY